MPDSAIATVLGYCSSYMSALLRRPYRYCSCCESQVLAFLPYKGGFARAPAIIEDSQMVGSDLDHFSCTRCRSTDRERHLFLYMKQLDFPRVFRQARVLHFAPERKLSAFIGAQQPQEYIRGDLFPTLPGMEKVDMQDIKYADSSFDVLLANHVLEHVDDDAVALAELYRVLKPGGFAILQTPYASAREKTESASGACLSDQQRLERFGQEDHVRLFGRDIFDRIAAAGFVSHVEQHATVLKDVDACVYGVNEQEPFMCFSKPAGD